MGLTWSFDIFRCGGAAVPLCRFGGRAGLLLCQLTGPLVRLALERFQNPLPLDQSIQVVWPYLTLQAGLTLVSFGLSCVVFMRLEIRSV